MRKRIILALVLLLLVLGIGLALAPQLFGDPTPPPETDGDAQVALVVDAGTDAGSDADADTGESPEAVLTGVNGRVMRHSETGELVEAHEGESVPADTMLETGEGTAVLSFGDDSTVELETQSAVTLAGVEDGVTNIRLERGRTVARSDGQPVRVTFAGSDAVAEAADGEIAAVSDGSGRVTVASQRGDVTLSARGETVEIGEGEESSVLPDAAPSEPRAVPSSFFLRVRRPPGQSRVAATTVQGEATPGSIVSVNGTPTEVDENGRFRARVALRQGNNNVTVRGRDASGRSQTRSHSVVVDSNASGISSDVTWD